MIGLIDTNLFKKLTKNAGDIHEIFVKGLGDEATTIKWTVTHFGFLEYVGLTVPNLSKLDPIPKGWTPPDAILDRYKQSNDPLIFEVEAQLAWVLSKAKEKYKSILTPKLLEKKAKAERRYHVKEFLDGPLDVPLFQKPLATYHPDVFAELLAIDYVHRHDEFPLDMRPLIRWLCRATVIDEYYDERRNVVLARAYKQLWLNRVKGPHESHIAESTMENLEVAMRSIKPNSDRFDLDLLVYFLVGFAVDGEYGPVTIYTQDNPSQVLSRLAVFFNFMNTTWDEWSHLDKVGPFPIQRTSRYRFVCDHGNVLQEISSDDFVGHLLAEGLIGFK